MKKILTLAAALCLLLCFFSFAEENPFSFFPGVPAPSQTPEADPFSAFPGIFGPLTEDNQMRATLDGQAYTLEYDNDSQYSNLKDGYIQASFYAETGDTMVELYLIFPESAEAGNTLGPDDGILSGDARTGVILFQSEGLESGCSIATQDENGIFPAGSGYQLSITAIDETEEGRCYTGTIDATLCGVDDDFNPLNTSVELSGSFSFTMKLPSKKVPSPFSSKQPSSGSLVTPPDAKKI